MSDPWMKEQKHSPTDMWGCWAAMSSLLSSLPWRHRLPLQRRARFLSQEKADEGVNVRLIQWKQRWTLPWRSPALRKCLTKAALVEQAGRLCPRGSTATWRPGPCSLAPRGMVSTGGAPGASQEHPPRATSPAQPAGGRALTCLLNFLYSSNPALSGSLRAPLFMPVLDRSVGQSPALCSKSGAARGSWKALRGWSSARSQTVPRESSSMPDASLQQF